MNNTTQPENLWIWTILLRISAKKTSSQLFSPLQSYLHKENMRIKEHLFPGREGNKLQLVLVNLQMRTNSVHILVWLLIYLSLPLKAAPSTHSNTDASIRTSLQCHMVSAVLTPKGEISDCFPISTEINVIYFFNFRCDIHEKILIKMHRSVFKKKSSEQLSRIP